jgi:diadenosine tetraphosphate (Ap4A) HIT family hydrolase
MEPTCLICGLEESAPSDVVFRDERWAAEIVPGYDVPGWFFLRARRHAEKITGLDEEEQKTFGRRARDMVAAVNQATGAEATYMLMFGESFPHFHVLITARTAEVPADRRAGDILKLRAEQADLERARELVPAIRTAYAEIASGAPAATGAGPSA